MSNILILSGTTASGKRLRAGDVVAVGDKDDQISERDARLLKNSRKAEDTNKKPARIAKGKDEPARRADPPPSSEGMTTKNSGALIE